MDEQPVGQFFLTQLLTQNLEKAKDFYSNVLGWRFKEIKINDITYTMVQANGKDIAGMLETPQERGIVPYWLNYILVLNVAKL